MAVSIALGSRIILGRHRAVAKEERDALEYAERMTITGEKVTEEVWAQLRSHFSEAQMVELTAAVALENFRSKFNVPLGYPVPGLLRAQVVTVASRTIGCSLQALRRHGVNTLPQ